MKKWSPGIIACLLATAISVVAAEPVGNPASNEQAVVASQLATGQQVVIDGKLDDPAWVAATEYAVAYKYSPVTVDVEIPKTTFRVLADERYLYIGVRCDDSHPEAIWKALAHRDAVTNADIVTVFIDPNGQKKFAQMFRLAAGGAIRDGTFYEESSTVDASPDFAFESATQVDAKGWSAELKIPASSLRINGHGLPRILVTRTYPRGNNFTFASTAIDSRHQCFLCKSPELTGLDNMKRGQALTVTPYASATHYTGDLGDATVGRAGVDIKWRLSASAVVDATVRPDFSQVELDTPQLSANTKYALFYPEKRPFFLEGLDFFDTPMRAAYTRTITKPSWGSRITNRSDTADFVALAARDEGGGLLLLPGPWSTDAVSQPVSTAVMARTRFHLLGAHAGLIAAIKDYGVDGNNIVGGGDAVFSTQTNRFNAQVLMSSTSALATGGSLAEGERESDSAEYLGWKHDSNKWHLTSFVQRTGDRFRDDSGFVESSGLYSASLNLARDVKPLPSFNQTDLYVIVTHKRTLDGMTIATDYLPGVTVDKGTAHMELFVSPISQTRTDPTLPLHRFSWAEFVFFATPERWLPTVEFVVDFGHRLDSLSDRVGSGYQARLTPSFLVRERLRIGATLAQERINADDQYGDQRILLRDSLAAINASYFFDANNELRGTYQYHEIYRDPLAFTQAVREHFDSNLVSLVYTWTPSLGKAFYAGGTWSSSGATAVTQGSELFAKMSWAF